MRETAPDSAALVQEIRERRERRHGLSFTRSQPPPATDDGIPYQVTTPRDSASPTNGLPYIITHAEPVNDRQVRYHYLLPSGRRRSVLLDALAVTEETHLQVVRAFEADDFRMAPGRPRRLSDNAGG